MAANSYGLSRAIKRILISVSIYEALRIQSKLSARKDELAKYVMSKVNYEIVKWTLICILLA